MGSSVNLWETEDADHNQQIPCSPDTWLCSPVLLVFICLHFSAGDLGSPWAASAGQWEPGRRELCWQTVVLTKLVTSAAASVSCSCRNFSAVCWLLHLRTWQSLVLLESLFAATTLNGMQHGSAECSASPGCKREEGNQEEGLCSCFLFPLGQREGGKQSSALNECWALPIPSISLVYPKKTIWKGLT